MHFKRINSARRLGNVAILRNGAFVCVALCLGIAALFGGTGGFIACGIIINRLSLTSVQQLRRMFFLGILGLASMFMFAVQCDAPRLADMTSHQHDLQNTV